MTGSSLVHAQLLLVVLGDELLDVGQLVVEILTAALLQVVVGVGLKKEDKEGDLVQGVCRHP